MSVCFSLVILILITQSRCCVVPPLHIYSLQLISNLWGNTQRPLLVKLPSRFSIYWWFLLELIFTIMVQMVVPPNFTLLHIYQFTVTKSSHFFLSPSLPPLRIFILFMGCNLLQPLFILILKLLQIWPVGSL